MEEPPLKLTYSCTLLLIAVAWFSLIGPGSPTALAQQPAEKILYSFTGSNGDGELPYAGLISDAAGNLYGTTYQGGVNNVGTVFELVNSSGTYSEKVLYSFTGSNGDGANPLGGLTMDASGNLYGTTFNGGADFWGTVFELVNSSGTYSETVLYSFEGSAGGGDGAEPRSALIADASGNLYGTTSAGGANGCGTVFELVNSSGTYSEQVLYSFSTSNGDGNSPFGSLTMDAYGNLYGTTLYGGDNSVCQEYASNGCGTVFELVNSSGTYSEQVLYSFEGPNGGPDGDGAEPFGALTMDASGNLYGTTFAGGYNNPSACSTSIPGCGTVFELVNSSGTYSEKVLHRFTAADGAFPYGALIADASGNLYGTAFIRGPNGGGVVFELVNSLGTYNEQMLYSFTGLNGDGDSPYGNLIMDSSGNLYSTTAYGGAAGGGTVFEIVNAELSLSSSHNPSTYGQSVTFTATLHKAFDKRTTRSSRKGAQPQSVGGTWSANTGCAETIMDSGRSQCVTSILPAGANTVTAIYEGGNVISGSITQTVQQALTTINVTGVNPSSELAGQNAPVTITAVLSWNSGGAAPTAAYLSIGGNGHGTYAPATCGSPRGNSLTCTATYTPNTHDTAGTYTEMANFLGDSNYTGSSSPQSGNFIITTSASDFAVSTTPSTATVVAGQSAWFTVTVTPQGSFTKSIRFSCSGLPARATCAFRPPTVSPGAYATSSDLTITTAAATASLASPAFGHPSRPLYAIWLMPLPAMLLGAVGLAKPRRRRLLSSILVCMLAGGCWLQTACGTGVSNGRIPGTAQGTYAITVTGTADSTQHNTTLKLTVQ